ncbi:MAG TPA: hypothetical protein QGF02_00280 [Candidatus Babeliales bacterium]|nr:hypothetical protein [Candidatus Babeliales bacterium]
MKLKIIILNILLCIPTVGFSMDSKGATIKMPSTQDLKKSLEQHGFSSNHLHQSIIDSLGSSEGSPHDLVKKTRLVVETAHDKVLNSIVEKDLRITDAYKALEEAMNANKPLLYEALLGHNAQLLEEYTN